MRIQRATSRTILPNIYWAPGPSMYNCTGCILHNFHVNSALRSCALVGSPVRVSSVPGPVKSIRIQCFSPRGLPYGCLRSVAFAECTTLPPVRCSCWGTERVLPGAGTWGQPHRWAPKPAGWVSHPPALAPPQKRLWSRPCTSVS